MNELKPGKYRHSKSGKFYEVIGVAVNSETREKVVVYKMLYEDRDFPFGSLWVRPFDMFTEIVEIDGEKKPRFEFVE